MGIQELLDSSQTPSIGHLARKYMLYGGYRFNGVAWEYAVNRLIRSLKTTQVVIQTQDNYEHDLLDSDDYYQFEGGINAALGIADPKYVLIMLTQVVPWKGGLK